MFKTKVDCKFLKCEMAFKYGLYAKVNARETKENSYYLEAKIAAFFDTLEF